MDQIRTQGGGVAALLDFGFTRFLTLSVVKILYVLGLCFIVLALLGAIVVGFSNGVVTGLGALVLGPIVAVLYMIGFRIWLELVVVIFRIGENTTKIAEMRGAAPAPGSAG